MILGFKTELKLNNHQRALLAKHAGVARHTYNWGLWFTPNFLNYKKANPEDRIKLPSAIDLHKLLVAAVKPANPWYYEVPTSSEYRSIKAKIAKHQYLNRNKLHGSSNWKQANLKLARLYYRATCIRKDTLHKLTSYLAKTFKVICIENLNVKGMMANHKLAGVILDMGFYEFKRQLEYKCKLYNSELVVIERWVPSSKTCSNCGAIKAILSLSQRVFHCDCCGMTCDRDLNAALNIERFGLSLSSLRLVDGEVPTPPVEAGKNQFVQANVSILGAVSP